MGNVREKRNIQTLSCRPSGRLSDLQLNKSGGSSSVASSKTLSNSSKESRKQKRVLAATASHNGSCSPKHSASREDFVFVLNKSGKALMPTKSGKARRMLKSGIAKVVSRTPFVIQMLVETCEYKQKLDAGMDTGSKTIGSAVKLNSIVIYAAKIKLRSDEIRSKMDQRRMYRRTRRGRKLRYRQARFLNRGASVRSGRLPPSVKHAVDSHLRERDFIHSILPKCHINWSVELASFDIHRITNPDVVSIGYQKGRKYGFYNTKAYVLSRDAHRCQKCKKSGNIKLHVHHIVFKSNGGSDSPDNLITLCDSCHEKLHSSKDAQKESSKFSSFVKKNTKDATRVSIVASQIRKQFGEFKETFGYETKIKREMFDFKKDHHIDAAFVASSYGEVVEMPMAFYQKRTVSQGDYQQSSGAHSEKRIPTGKLFGLRKFDLISTTRGVGFVRGKRSSGYFAISNIFGDKIHDSVNVKKSAKRLAARKTVLTIRMEQRFLPDVNDGVPALRC